MSAAIYFLTVSEVIDIHDTLLELFGGDEGVMGDGELLRSALSAPEAGISGGYLHADLFEMAAAYMYHIILDHPFIDANKRTGCFSAIAFLKANGIAIAGGGNIIRDLALSVQREDGRPRTTKREIADVLRSLVVK